MSGSTGLAPISRQRTFLITDIPHVMQFKKGWPVAAQLMRRWFVGPSYQMTNDVKLNYPGVVVPNHALDESIVKMAWLRQFSRFDVAMQKVLVAWDSQKGREMLRDRVTLQYPAERENWRFGDLTKPASVLDKTCQVNIQPFGGLTDPLDELYGAIGVGLVKIAVSGMVKRLSNGRMRIEVDEVGLYLRDTYDFNDDNSKLFSQPLGYWGWTGVSRAPQVRGDIEIEPKSADDDTPSDRLYAVQNDDFRAYRERSHRGGDFVIYSDVLRMKLPQPKVLDL